MAPAHTSCLAARLLYAICCPELRSKVLHKPAAGGQALVLLFEAYSCNPASGAPPLSPPFPCSSTCQCELQHHLYIALGVLGR